jgi:hypothetical protein
MVFSNFFKLLTFNMEHIFLNLNYFQLIDNLFYVPAYTYPENLLCVCLQIVSTMLLLDGAFYRCQLDHIGW